MIRKTTIGFALAVALFAGGIAALFFWQSALPNMVVFSNDTTLGSVVKIGSETQNPFLGTWRDEQWLGFNQGPYFLSLSHSLLTLKPILWAKIYAPLSIFLAGFCAAIFARTIGLRFLPSALFACAVALNNNLFSHACWGLGSRPIVVAGDLLVLAVLMNPAAGPRWARLVFAGLTLGLGILDGLDFPIILCIYIGAFVIFHAWNSRADQGGKWWSTALGAVAALTLVTLCAAWMSSQALVSMIPTQITNAEGMDDSEEARAERWNWATQWSLPKLEVVRTIIPGFFGYRMDTPNGGNYWGSVGRTPGWEETRKGLREFCGAGEYLGLLVAVGALWAVLAAAGKYRRHPFSCDAPGEPIYSEREKRFIYFWAACALVSLLLAFGRHAPFYEWVYSLPYFSTIRNPIKFMHPFTLSALILFAYSLLGWSRRYFSAGISSGSDAAPLPPTPPDLDAIKSWATDAASPDERKWLDGLKFAVAVAVSLLFSQILSRHALGSFLQASEWGGLSKFIVAHLTTELWIFLFFLLLTAVAVVSVMAGCWRGPRAAWGWLLLIALLIVDLGRANAPFISFFNYRKKYATNPVIDFLRKDSHEHRVATLQREIPEFSEWLQNHFLFYKIQSLDVAQLPRPPKDYTAFMNALSEKPDRLWQLTNTRYMLAATNALEKLNAPFVEKGEDAPFSVKLHFGFQGVPGRSRVIEGLGGFGVIEFNRAMPRAKLFSQWQAADDEKTLELLADENFDPSSRVIVASSHGQFVPILPPPAPVIKQPKPMLVSEAVTEKKTKPKAAKKKSAATSVKSAKPEACAEIQMPPLPEHDDRLSFVSYKANRIELDADNKTDAVLLLNDHYDTGWRATVDGASAPLLRCNYVMRGVHLKPGKHRVIMEFVPQRYGYDFSRAALLAWVLSGGALLFFSLFVTPPAARPQKDETATC